MSDTGMLTGARGRARVFAESFERIQRGDETITALKGGCPEWCVTATREAHGDTMRRRLTRMPDDWTFEHAQHVVDAIDELLHSDQDADLDEARHEIVDSLVDIYTPALTAWLASSLHRVAVVDEAAEEYGPSDNLIQALMVGQYFELDEIYGAVATAIMADDPR